MFFYPTGYPLIWTTSFPKWKKMTKVTMDEGEKGNEGFLWRGKGPEPCLPFHKNGYGYGEDQNESIMGWQNSVHPQWVVPQAQKGMLISFQ